MTVTEKLRRAVVESGETHYSIGQATGINARALDRFVAGKDIRGVTIDKLADHLGFELCRKKRETSGKQSRKRQTTGSRSRKKPKR